MIDIAKTTVEYWIGRGLERRDAEAVAERYRYIRNAQILGIEFA